jgi:SAM-dependent methyltransferase
LRDGSYATFGMDQSWRQLRHALLERQRAASNMEALLELVRRDERRMAERLGREISGLRILEVGPGQGMERSRFFGQANDVVAMDTDVVPQGLRPGAYARMLSQNGVGRTVKTIGRKVILGRANGRAWSRAMGVKSTKPPLFIEGDICTTIPGHEAFDAVMSWSVFEHLADPETALDNILSALAPGGILFISIHLYTAHNGHHDIRAFTGSEAELPAWGHLRPSAKHLIRPSSFLNEWRLERWRGLFSALAPGAEEFREVLRADEFQARMTPDIRQELSEYTDEELSTVDVIFAWRKPSGPSTAGLGVNILVEPATVPTAEQPGRI